LILKIVELHLLLFPLPIKLALDGVQSCFLLGYFRGLLICLVTFAR
jgi:hypothetical protein